jgi:hypothetical protein
VIAQADAAGAQRLRLSSLRVGDTVRVWGHGPPLNRTVAVVASIESDHLVLTDVPGHPIHIGTVDAPIEALRRLHVQRGIRLSAADMFVGSALGFAGGVMIGGLVGGFLLCGAASYKSGCDAPFAGFAAGGLLGGVVGAIAGAYIGSRPRSRWEPVSLSP